MITYETARKLKDAGFPQKSEISWVCTTDYNWRCNRCGTKESNAVSVPESCPNLDCNAYIPTLSELIAACGDRFRLFNRLANEHPTLQQKGGWLAVSGEFEERIDAFGDTPEEAVANLWLELNKR